MSVAAAAMQVPDQASSASIAAMAAIISALVAAVVSLYTNFWTARRADRLLRRELLSEAFQVCMAYKEFPFRVRRRRADQPSEERARLTAELNRVQERLAFFESWTSLEGLQIRHAYEELVEALRKFAGPEISKAWTTPPIETDDEVSIKDIDLSSIRPFELAYSNAVRRRV